MTPILLPLACVTPVFAPLVGRRVGLVYYRPHGNCGDRLIEAATEQLLNRFGIEYRVIDPAEPGDVDVILCGGGGNYGHWRCPAEAGRRFQALASGKPCILLPQTAYGPESPCHYAAAFVRDVPSLAHVPGSVLAPDLALCYTPERPLPPPIHARLEAFIRGPEGLHRERGIDPRHLHTDPRDYLDWVASHAEIFTDSLHCAVCGLIARRKVTLHATALPKQRGVWEAWLADLGCRWGG